MRKILAICLCLLSWGHGFSQDMERVTLNRLADMLEANDIQALSEHVAYPLHRPNPVPYLETPREFILYYPVLFDSAFKAETVHALRNEKDIIRRGGNLGFMNGNLWLDHDGKILAVNKSSEAETRLAQQLTAERQRTIYPKLRHWKRNVLLCQTSRFLIRIDELTNGTYRYASWALPKKMSDKPDLILKKGKRVFHGTGGDMSYIFRNGPWTYTLDYVHIGAVSEDELGWTLRVEKNGKEKLMDKAELVD